MAYTAQQLITRSWYLSGIVSRNLQVPTGDQITDGLQMLNDLLNFKQIEIDLIPYYTYIELTLVPNQEYYFLPYVAAIETATFNLDTVRYPMNFVSRSNYYGGARVNNISTLPFSWNFIRGDNGGTFATYFLPQSNYTCNLMVKLFLTDVALETDLTNVSPSLQNAYTFVETSNAGYDTGYIEYLRYSLAKYMASEYGVSFNPESEKILQSYARKLMYIGPPDLRMKKGTMLASQEQGALTWAQVNLGRGFTPS
jgi:hypothetical protein